MDVARVSAGFDDGIVGQGLPSAVVYGLLIEIGGVVVVASQKHYPVV